ncbi:unnamed protein product [Eruca vesicaria subsp. sativa]|uniref:Protein kinase domain-containing protein n=1 Tax=Eruca vesicaria subsp. sativa TaxID=29727 RepID=A0ABC8J8M1_ERUVS|nr:unnamed protein product [Eruca vesicaria subsp. sativa]
MVTTITNLLLSTDDNDAALKIADFGFARSHLDLSYTISPLKISLATPADLWSVGAILFQLVTGRTPFTGNSQVELFQNIMISTGLQFPLDCKDLTTDCKDLCRKLLRHNPVERLKSSFTTLFYQTYNHRMCQGVDPFQEQWMIFIHPEAVPQEKWKKFLM